MDKGFICGGNKYEIIGANKDVISLPVSIENLPEEIIVGEITLYLPSPFHVSLIYTERIIKKYNISIPNFSDKILDDFCDFTKTNNIDIKRYKNDEYKLVTREGVKSTVIVMCEVLNLNNFFDLINKKYGLKIEYPTTHVTLYNTLKGQPGISLMDADDIKNLTKPIPNPIGRTL